MEVRASTGLGTWGIALDSRKDRKGVILKGVGRIKKQFILRKWGQEQMD